MVILYRSFSAHYQQDNDYVCMINNSVCLPKGWRMRTSSLRTRACHRNTKIGPDRSQRPLLITFTCPGTDIFRSTTLAAGIHLTDSFAVNTERDKKYWNAGTKCKPNRLLSFMHYMHTAVVSILIWENE